jgi:hypothetical protein
MSGGATKPSDRPDEIAVEDESDMTSIMSSDQARALKEAAADDTGTLERDTAKPPPMDTQPKAVAIPKAPAVPSVAPAAAAPEAVSSAARSGDRKDSSRPRAHAGPDEPAPKPAAPAKSGGRWEIVAFILLAASVVYALRG